MSGSKSPSVGSRWELHQSQGRPRTMGGGQHVLERRGPELGASSQSRVVVIVVCRGRRRSRSAARSGVCEAEVEVEVEARHLFTGAQGVPRLSDFRDTRCKALSHIRLYMLADNGSRVSIRGLLTLSIVYHNSIIIAMLIAYTYGLSDQIAFPRRLARTTSPVPIHPFQSPHPTASSPHGLACEEPSCGCRCACSC